MLTNTVPWSGEDTPTPGLTTTVARTPAVVATVSWDSVNMDLDQCLTQCSGWVNSYFLINNTS